MPDPGGWGLGALTLGRGRGAALVGVIARHRPVAGVREALVDQGVEVARERGCVAHARPRLLDGRQHRDRPGDQLLGGGRQAAQIRLHADGVLQEALDDRLGVREGRQVRAAIGARALDEGHVAADARVGATDGRIDAVSLDDVEQVTGERRLREDLVEEGEIGDGRAQGAHAGLLGVARPQALDGLGDVAEGELVGAELDPPGAMGGGHLVGGEVARVVLEEVHLRRQDDVVGPEDVDRLHLVGAADRDLVARQGRRIELQDARDRLERETLLELLEHLQRVLGAQPEVAAADLLVAVEHLETTLDPLGRPLGRDALAVEQVQQGVGGLERGLGVGGGDLAHQVEVGRPVARAQPGEDRRQRRGQLDRVLAPLLVAPVAGGQLGAQLLRALDLGLHLAQLALEVAELGASWAVSVSSGGPAVACETMSTYAPASVWSGAS